MQKYISEIVTIKEIKKWQPGQRILICAQTGRGKSQMIKDNLYIYAKQNNKKILLMSNRILLKKQNEYEIQNKRDVIDLHNYQEFESRILSGIEDIYSLFEPYDYIVYDEGHYAFADSAFNTNTDLLIDPIKNTPKNKIFLFLTATPEALTDYQPDFDYIYDLPRDYSYIKTVYFYDRNAKIANNSIESIINNIPKDEKILYFGSRVEDIYKLSLKFKDSSFICSPSNKLKNKSDISTFLEIEELEKFNKRILFATKVLDNGVNLKDKTLKHIIIDVLDPISFLQTLGRKRSISPDDTICLYVRNYHKGLMHYVLEGIDKQLHDIEKENEIETKILQQKFPEYNFNKTQEKRIKVAKYQHLLTQKRLIQEIKSSISESAYAEYICKILGKNIEDTKDAFLEFEKISMEELLKQYLSIKMFKDNQEIFKHMFFNMIFSTKKTDYSARGLIAMNRIIAEDGLPYTIFSRREDKGANRKKYYWIVEEK